MIKPRRYRIALSREGWCYVGVVLFILLGALIRDINLLVLLFGMLVGPLLYSWAAVVLALRGVEVVREVPSEVVAGDFFEVRLQLTNRKRRLNSWVVTVDDRIEPVLVPTACSAAQGGVLFFRTAAGQTSHGSYRARLTQRGQYRLGPLVVGTRFPLGLIRRSMVFDDRAMITVLPRLGRLRSGWSQPNPAVAHASRSSDRRRGTLEGEFQGLREWRAGDSARWIHWRTSARRGELMVRQFERQRNYDLALLVDLWQPAEPSAADLERVELAVSLAATILRETCQHSGGQLWLITAGQEVALVKGAASLGLFHDGLEGLAIVQAAARDHLSELVELADREIPTDKRTVLVSTRNAPADAQHAAVLALAGERRGSLWDRVETINVGSTTLDQYFHPG